MIDIQHVTKRYGALYALRDVSLHVEKGSVLGLLGQNGAGKTTLINILTGYLAPTEGWALLAGHDALLEPEEARKHLGYLPEVPPLYDEMTVREYLRFAARLKGVESRAVPAHVDEIMELCGLTQMQRRLLSHLSKGYRQRAGLAQALCGDPEILVLDEPTVGLDPKQITEIRALIRRLSREKTILFSSGAGEDRHGTGRRGQHGRGFPAGDGRRGGKIHRAPSAGVGRSAATDRPAGQPSRPHRPDPGLCRRGQ